MNTLKIILRYLFAVLMILAGVNHFLKPTGYLPFVPDFLPQMAIVYLSGIVEIAVGLAVFIPKYRHWGTLGILILMLVFLPLHTLDFFSQNPAIGSHQAAVIRLPIQFVLIAWAWFIHKN